MSEDFSIHSMKTIKLDLGLEVVTIAIIQIIINESSIIGDCSIRVCRSVYCINEYPVGYTSHHAGIAINALTYSK